MTNSEDQHALEPFHRIADHSGIPRDQSTNVTCEQIARLHGEATAALAALRPRTGRTRRVE